MAKEDRAAQTLLDYIMHERAPFLDVPFGPVDSAALTQVAMARSAGVLPAVRCRSNMPRLLDGVADRLHALRAARVTMADFAHRIAEAPLRDDSLVTGFTRDLVVRELALMAGNPRFRDARIVDYASAFDDASTGSAAAQFAAMTFVMRGRVASGDALAGALPDETPSPFAYVAFRGTDASIAGWRENFDMAYATPVPAQRMAADYLASVARHLPKRIVVGGHSKGGNLALFAALTAEPAVRERIARVYVHDAPGFKRGVFSAGDYAPLAGRIHRTVPDESFVGMLLDHEGAERVVRSTAHGIDQHSVFTWEVNGRDFSYAERLSDSAMLAREAMSDWLAGFSDAEVHAVVDAVFAAIEASGAQSASDLFERDPMRIVRLVSDAAKGTDGTSREVLLSAAGKLAGAVARRFGRVVTDAVARIAAPGA